MMQDYTHVWFICCAQMVLRRRTAKLHHQHVRPGPADSHITYLQASNDKHKLSILEKVEHRQPPQQQLSQLGMFQRLKHICATLDPPAALDLKKRVAAFEFDPELGRV
jgi:hypothetical protein